jgi:thiosulfate dehydrogenase
MKTVWVNLLLGIAIGMFLVPSLFYLYIRSGAAPVTASAPSLPLEKFFAKTALHAKMDSEIIKTVPVESSEEAWLAGAVTYRESCAVCHGLPNRPPSIIGKSMFPIAPQLFETQTMVTDDPPGKIFWKAKNGIRLSGMPGFKDSLTDHQLWQVSVLLAAADKIPADVVRVLVSDPNPSVPAK